MDKQRLAGLRRRKDETLEEIKAISRKLNRYRNDDQGLALGIQELEAILNELFGQLSELQYELDKVQQRDKNRPELFELISPMDLGKNDPFGKSLGEAPIPSEPQYTASVYYYWWLFLRLSREYAECVRNGGKGPLTDLFEDFGDVFSTDFATWWGDRGVELFSYKFETDVTATVIRDPSLPVVRDGRIAISIPLNGNTKNLIAEVNKTIREEVRIYKQSHRELAPKYQPGDRYTIFTLHNKAVIFQAIEGALHGESHLKIFEQIRPRLKIKLNWLRTPQKKRQFMSEEYRDAKILIENVKFGRFPDFEHHSKPKKLQSPKRSQSSRAKPP